jgi:hypothetical protein
MSCLSDLLKLTGYPLGLGALIEKLTDNLAVFIYTTLGQSLCLFVGGTADMKGVEPFMKPILQSATTALQSGSAEVINSHDQYEVFNDPRAVSQLIALSFYLNTDFALFLLPLVRSNAFVPKV